MRVHGDLISRLRFMCEQGQLDDISTVLVEAGVPVEVLRDAEQRTADSHERSGA